MNLQFSVQAIFELHFQPVVLAHDANALVAIVGVDGSFLALQSASAKHGASRV
jgi:hypothetical protein